MITHESSNMDESNIPGQYRQPDKEFTGRIVRNKTELVTYNTSSHVRIWYNNLEIGYSLHSHDAVEVIICIQNPYEIHVNDHTYNMNEGDILIIPPRLPHEYVNDKPGIRFIYLIEMPYFFESADYQSIESLFFNAFLCNKVLQPRIYDDVYQHFMNMNDAYFKNEPFWETTVFSNMYQIFTLIGKNALRQVESEEHGFSQTYSRITALLHYLDVNYAEDISTDQAALFTGFSKYHFLRLFKQQTGYTFHDYLNLKRIKIAEELLTGDMQVTDIAFRTGFNNLPSFCRTFKKYTNYSPSEYKKLRISEEINKHSH